MPAISSLVAQKSKASYRSGEWPTSQEIDSLRALLRTTGCRRPRLPSSAIRSSLRLLLLRVQHRLADSVDVLTERDPLCPFHSRLQLLVLGLLQLDVRVGGAEFHSDGQAHSHLGDVDTGSDTGLPATLTDPRRGRVQTQGQYFTGLDIRVSCDREFDVAHHASSLATYRMNQLPQSQGPMSLSGISALRCQVRVSPQHGRLISSAGLPGTLS